MWASQKLLGFDFKYLTTGSIEPGSLRGSHYHKRTLEQFMCVAGKIAAYLDNETTMLEPGDIVNIPANVVHTFVNENVETAYFIEFKNVEFDKNDPDTYKVDIEHLRKGKK